jgi:hypothetical protein
MVKLTAEQKANIINQYKSGDTQGAIDQAKAIRDNATATPTTPANPVSTYSEASEF